MLKEIIKNKHKVREIFKKHEQTNGYNKPDEIC